MTRGRCTLYCRNFDLHQDQGMEYVKQTITEFAKRGLNGLIYNKGNFTLANFNLSEYIFYSSKQSWAVLE